MWMKPGTCMWKYVDYAGIFSLHDELLWWVGGCLFTFAVRRRVSYVVNVVSVVTLENPFLMKLC